MNNYVFISYKREEHEFANRIRAVLSLATRAEIWWDENLQAGGIWNEDLDSALRNAGCVIVIWSRLSVQSDWVKQEASFAKYAGTILPVLKEQCQVPTPFQSIQTADLTRWSGDEREPEFVKVAERTAALIAFRKRRAQQRRRARIAMVLAGLGLLGLGYSAQEVVDWRLSFGDSQHATRPTDSSRVATAVRGYRFCAEQEGQFVCRVEADAMAERCTDLVGRR